MTNFASTEAPTGSHALPRQVGYVVGERRAARRGFQPPTGTWDVISSGGRADQGTAVITVDASTFVFSSRESTPAFTVSGERMTHPSGDHRERP